MRLIRDGENGEEGAMEVGGGGEYIPIYIYQGNGIEEKLDLKAKQRQYVLDPLLNMYPVKRMKHICII